MDLCEREYLFEPETFCREKVPPRIFTFTHSCTTLPMPAHLVGDSRADILYRNGSGSVWNGSAQLSQLEIHKAPALAADSMLTVHESSLAWTACVHRNRR